MTLSRRLKAMGSPKYQRDGDSRTSGPGFGLTLHPPSLEVPQRWSSPRLIFVNSMSDLFHESVPLEFIADVFAVIRETPQHTYQALTKRSRRLMLLAPQLDWPKNLWMGVSVETRRFIFRTDHLRAVPAAVRFISAEPLLGSLGALNLTHPADFPQPRAKPHKTPAQHQSQTIDEQPLCGPCRTRTCDQAPRSIQDNPVPVRVARCFLGSIPRISHASNGLDQPLPTSTSIQRVVQLAGLRRTS